MIIIADYKMVMTIFIADHKMLQRKGTAHVAVELHSMLLVKSWSFRTHDWQGLPIAS